MSSITGTAESIGLPSAHPKRLALASMVGTTLEYYDFTIYNTMAALVFSQLFFPSVDPMVGTMLAFSTYAIGYLVTPARRPVFWPPRRQDRPPRRPCDNADHHGANDCDHRPAADLWLRRNTGAAAADNVALRAGCCSRRRMGGRGLAGSRAWTAGPAGTQCLVDTDGTRPGHPSWDRPDLWLYVAHGQRNFPRMGLARPFSSQPCLGHVWAVGSQRRRRIADVQAARRGAYQGRRRRSRRSSPIIGAAFC